MSAVVRAEQAVTEARRGVAIAAHNGHGTPTALDALVRAVRELVACEIEKSEFQRGPISGSNHYVSGYSDGLGDAARTAREGHAALVHPDTQEQP